jgi:hypothetical protein
MEEIGGVSALLFGIVLFIKDDESQTQSQSQSSILNDDILENACGSPKVEKRKRRPIKTLEEVVPLASSPILLLGKPKKTFVASGFIVDRETQKNRSRNPLTGTRISDSNSDTIEQKTKKRVGCFARKKEKETVISDTDSEPTVKRHSKNKIILSSLPSKASSSDSELTPKKASHKALKIVIITSSGQKSQPSMDQIELSDTDLDPTPKKEIASRYKTGFSDTLIDQIEVSDTDLDPTPKKVIASRYKTGFSDTESEPTPKKTKSSDPQSKSIIKKIKPACEKEIESDIEGFPPFGVFDRFDLSQESEIIPATQYMNELIRFNASTEVDQVVNAHHSVALMGSDSRNSVDIVQDDVDTVSDIQNSFNEAVVLDSVDILQNSEESKDVIKMTPKGDGFDGTDKLHAGSGSNKTEGPNYTNDIEVDAKNDECSQYSGVYNAHEKRFKTLNKQAETPTPGINNIVTATSSSGTNTKSTPISSEFITVPRTSSGANTKSTAISSEISTILSTPNSFITRLISQQHRHDNTPRTPLQTPQQNYQTPNCKPYRIRLEYQTPKKTTRTMLIPGNDGPNGTPKLIKYLPEEYKRRYKERHGTEVECDEVYFENEILCPRDSLKHVLENNETVTVFKKR